VKLTFVLSSFSVLAVRQLSRTFDHHANWVWRYVSLTNLYAWGARHGSSLSLREARISLLPTPPQTLCCFVQHKFHAADSVLLFGWSTHACQDPVRCTVWPSYHVTRRCQLRLPPRITTSGARCTNNIVPAVSASSPAVTDSAVGAEKANRGWKKIC